MCIRDSGWGVLAQSWASSSRSNSSLAVPLIVPQALWWVGYAWFVLCGALVLLRALTALARGNWVAIHALIGARSIQDEADEELANAQAARETAARGGRP